MAQVTIDIKAIRANQGNFRFEAIADNGQVIRRELALSDFEDHAGFAQWLLTQEPDETINSSYRKRLIITFHADEEGLKVLDSVDVQSLPEEKALSDIGAIPNWATWDVAQATDWIETNVTNLTTAKTSIKALAVMVIHLRDTVQGLKRSIE